MKLYLIYFIAGLTLALMLSVKTCNSYRTDRNRLANNQRTLLSEVEFYRTKDSLSAASAERLTLSNQEFKQYCGELEKTVKDLGIQVKRLRSVSQTATETRYEVKTILRDSLILRAGTTDTIRCLDYQDPYLTLSGCLHRNQFSGLIQSRDTLIQVVHRVPRKFWFIRWGTKAIRQEIISKNPYSRITYTEYIELKK